MSAQTFEFEGEQVTAMQLHERMPGYSASFVRRALQPGITTKAALAVRREMGHRAMRDASKFGKAKSQWKKGFATPLSSRKAG